MDENDEKRDNRFLWESWAGVIGSLGLTTVLLVIIGRLWTTTYFDHFGLPSSGMEFSVYDFAFRSLEALISLLLGAIGFSVAWLMRGRLKRWGFITALVELCIAGLLVAWVFFFLAKLPDSWLAFTGVLGLSNGLALAVMAWLGVDVWVGPGGGVDNWPKRLREPLVRWLGGHAEKGVEKGVEKYVEKVRTAVEYVWRKWLRGLLAGRWGGHVEKGVDEGAEEGMKKAKTAVEYVWRIIAVGMFLGVGFGYLPAASERLADIEAAADVARGRFAAAILESGDPLPEAIASSADPRRSNPVRVILTQSENTYVLHSTDCTTIGELDVPISVEDILPLEAPDVCKVFTIPTTRLMSIEYFQVSGKAPPNESMLRPIEVPLGDEPFEESFSSEGASDEEGQLRCKIGPTGDAEPGDEIRTDFFNSVWFEFTPSSDGAVLARVEAADFEPAVGIWTAPEGSADVQVVEGSGDNGFACETDVAVITEPSPDPGTKDQRKNVVGVVANVRAGTRYVVSVGAQENEGGLGSVLYEFTPGAYFFSPAIAATQAQVPELETVPESETSLLGAVQAPEAQDLVPQLEIPSGVGDATLELWRLDSKTYELQPLADISEHMLNEFLSGRFVLESEERRSRYLERTTDGEGQPIALIARRLAEGVWTLVAPERFVGLARLTSSVHPDLMLAFADTSSPPLSDTRVQSAVLLVLEESAIRGELGYEGNVIFDPESYPRALEIPRETEDREFGARLLVEEAGFEEGFPIQVQVEEERQTLLDAAAIVEQRLLSIGLEASIEPCADACIRVFFRTEDQE